jgi:mannitol PTS system EIIA component
MADAAPVVADLLDRRAIRLAEPAADRDDAIRRCGQALIDVGAVEPSYLDSMLARERSISTYVGEGVAIPHGTLAGKDVVRRDALSFLRFPAGVDWDGSEVTVAIGLAARGDGHVGILAALAQILLEPDRAEALRQATDVDDVLRLLQPEEDEEEDES